MIARQQQLDRQVSVMGNGAVKIITGLRNARLGFREQEETHLMENIVYNELIRRGYSVARAR